MNYRLLGYISLFLLATVTAPWWLRKLNALTVKTKDKRFMAVVKFLRKIHKPVGIALVAIALWHGFSALGTLRLHTGLLAYLALVLTVVLGIIHWRKKDKRVFKGHKVMVVVSAALLALHLLWPGAVWHLFRV